MEKTERDERADLAERIQNGESTLARAAEPEGEALSLDSIDDLVLPGDMDPGEEQQNQRWRITDDALAPLSMDLLQNSASPESGRPQTPLPAGQNGRQNAPKPQGGGNGQPRQQSAKNGSQSAQRKRQEKTRAQLFLPENAKIKKYEKIS